MARLLVRLKLRLLANTLQRGGGPAIGLVGSALVGLAAGGWGFWLTSTVETPGFWSDVVVLVYATLFVGWLLLPAMTFAADETLDPRRFALLPVGRWQLASGLLVAGAVGVGPAGTLLAAGGVVLGTWRLSGSPMAAAGAALAAVLLLTVAVAWSRAVLTLASRLLASRRGRDLVAVLGVLLGLVIWVVMVTGRDLLVSGPDAASAPDLSGPAAVARWLPGGLAGGVVADLAAGRWGPATLGLVGVAGWIAAALGLWTVGLRWTQGRAAAPPAVARRRADLYPLGLRWLPRTRTTAVAVRFLRGLVRDARVRTQALMHLVLVLPVLGVVVGAGGLRAPWSPLLAVLAVVPVAMLGANQLGLDGPALWLHEAAGARPVADLLGRGLGLALAALPLVGVLALVLAALNGAWAHLPVALVAATATLAVALGVAGVAAVILPAPVPEEPDNLFGSSEAGQGCLGSVLMVATLVVTGLLLLPVLLPLRLVAGAGPRLLVASLGVGYGALVLAGGTALAARVLAARGPEVLGAVDSRRA